MTVSDDFRLDLAAYARDELEEGQRIALEEHLEGCADCRSELDEITEAARLASMLPMEFQPPRRLEERTFALIELEKERSLASDGSRVAERPATVRSIGSARSRPRFSARTLFAPGLAAAFVALGLLSMSLWARTTDLQSQLEDARTDGSSEAAAVVDLASEGDADVSGSARLVALGDDNYRIVLEADDLPAPPTGYHYELWLGSGKGWTSAGSFTNRGEDTTFEFRTAVDPVEFPIIDITLEPIDGQPNRDGKDVLRGRLDISELDA